MLRSFVAGILAAALILTPVAQACTGIRLIAKDGGVVAARTLEFGFDLLRNSLVPAHLLIGLEVGPSN